MAAGLDPQQVADNWRYVRQTLKRYAKGIALALLCLALALAWVRGARYGYDEALASCSTATRRP